MKTYSCEQFPNRVKQLCWADVKAVTFMLGIEFEMKFSEFIGGNEKTSKREKNGNRVKSNFLSTKIRGSC